MSTSLEHVSKSNVNRRSNLSYRMPVDVFGHRVYDNVCAEIKRVLDVWAKERVVHHNQDAMFVGYACYIPYIHQTQCGIARCLDPYQLRLVEPDEFANV